MLFYRVLQFSYLVDTLIRLFPKIILIIIYLFLVGIALVGITNFSYSNMQYALYNPSWTFKYIYNYIIWFWYQKYDLTLKDFIKIMIALVSPSILIKLSKKAIILALRYCKKYFKIFCIWVWLKIKVLYKHVKRNGKIH